MTLEQLRLLVDNICDKYEKQLLSFGQRRKLIYNFADAASNFSQMYIDDNGNRILNIPIASSCDADDSNISLYACAEAIITSLHELYHAHQTFYSDETSMLSYISRQYNDFTYMQEYSNFTYEIDAERYALQRTFVELNQLYGEEISSNIILDYIRAKTSEKNGCYDYFIDGPVNSIQEVFDKFDEAYNRSLHHKKDFAAYPNDLVGKVLNSDAKLKQIYDAIPIGKEQAHFASCIVLSQHRELYKILKLKKEDYNLSQFVKQRELPHIDYDSVNDIEEISR